MIQEIKFEAMKIRLSFTSISMELQKYTSNPYFVQKNIGKFDIAEQHKIEELLFG